MINSRINKKILEIFKKLVVKTFTIVLIIVLEFTTLTPTYSFVFAQEITPTNPVILESETTPESSPTPTQTPPTPTTTVGPSPIEIPNSPTPTNSSTTPTPTLISPISPTPPNPSPTLTTSPTQPTLPSPTDILNLITETPTPASDSAEKLGTPSATPQPSLAGFTGISGFSAKIRKSISLKPQNKHLFKAIEKVTYTLENPEQNEITVQIFDKDKNEINLPIFKENYNGETTIRLKAPASFKPGKYTMKITDQTGKTIEQDFTWGVLAINTNKSIFLENEEAKLSMAVLDENGAMVCDAKVTLRIQSEKSGVDDVLSTENGKIIINEECKLHAKTDKPDYEANYKVKDEGTYIMDLTVDTKNGSYAITDYFQVQKTVPFDVERKTATRIYPPSTYDVQFNININQDFQGTIEETVPSTFEITKTNDNPEYSSVVEVVENVENDSNPLEVQDIRIPFNGKHEKTLGYNETPDDPKLQTYYQSLGLTGHDGMDFDMPEGTIIYAVADGTIDLAKGADYGNTVVINHSWGSTYYGHVSKIMVQKNDKVKKGEIIALSGNTGYSTTPHLHFGIKPNNADMENGFLGKIDPELFLHTQNVLTQTVKKIAWKDVNLKKGDKLTIGYTYKAPNISPEFYLLGPLTFKSENSELTQKLPVIPSGSEESSEASQKLPVILSNSEGSSEANNLSSSPTPTGSVLDATPSAIASSEASPSPSASLPIILSEVEESSEASQKSPVILASEAHPESTFIFKESRQWQIAADVPDGTGMLVYDEDGANSPSPHYRTWSGTDLSDESDMAANHVVTVDVNHTIIEASPTRDEYIRGTLDNAGHLNVRVYSGGAWGDGGSAPANGDFTTGIGTTNDIYRGFDIAYEETTGDAMVVYESSSSVNGTIMYRTWDGSNWSGENTLTYSGTTGYVAGVAFWVELEGDYGSNNILLAFKDGTNNDVYAMRWDGSTWVNSGSDLYTRITGSGVISTKQDFDIAWEGTSGKGKIVYATGTTTGASTYTTGSGWAADSSPFNPALAVQWIRIAGSPQNNYIAVIMSAVVSTSASDVYVDMWNGTDWTTVTTMTGDLDVNNNGYAQPVDVAWEQASSADRALFAWRDGPTSETSLRYMVYDISVGAYRAIDDDSVCDLTGTNTDQTVTSLANAENSSGPCTGLGAWADQVSGVDLNPDPGSRKIMIVAEDMTADLAPEAQLWNGTDTGTWLTQTSKMNAFEIDLSTGTTLSTSFPTKPYDFAFRRSENVPFSVAGTIYLADETTQATLANGGPCNDNSIVTLLVNGAASQTTSCSSTDASYSFSTVSASAGGTITIYLTSSDKANRVYVSDGAADSGMSLYLNAIVIADEQDGTVTNADLSDYDNSNNATDMLFDADAGAMNTDPSTELHVWAGDTYAPGGNVTISGSLDNAGTMTWSTYTTTFDATNTGNYLSGTLNGTSAFNKLTFNGSSGAWAIQNSILITAANAADTLQITAGTVTLGNGTGDNLDVRGRFIISSGATFQTLDTLAEGNTITVNIADAGTPCADNCIVDVLGTMTINKNATLSFNSNTSVQSGIEVGTTGILNILGTQDYSDTVATNTTSPDTKICATTSISTSQAGKHIMMKTGLAKSRVYTIGTTVTSGDGDCSTGSGASNTISSIVAAAQEDFSTADTGSTIMSDLVAGYSKIVCSSLDTMIDADNKGVGQYIHNTTDNTYYLIVDSTNNDAACAGSKDRFIVTAANINPDSLTSLGSGDDIKISHGIRAGDTYEIIDYATVTAHSTNHGYIYSKASSQTNILYADISELGASASCSVPTTNKCGITALTINGYTAGESFNISDSYIHDVNKALEGYALKKATFNNNYVYNATGSRPIHLTSLSNNTTFNGNRIDGNYASDVGISIQDSTSYNVTVSNNIIYKITAYTVEIANGSQIAMGYGNTLYLGSNSGFQNDGTSNSTFINNTIFHYSGVGIVNWLSSNNRIAGNKVFNVGTGINHDSTSTDITYLINNDIGVEQVNSGSDYDLNNTATSIISYNTKFGSTNEVIDVTAANAYFASYKHDQTEGSTKIWGEYPITTAIAETPQSEETQKFNYADNTFEDSFTPHLFQGSGTGTASLGFTFNTGVMAGTENHYVYKVVYNGTNWDVYRNELTGTPSTATTNSLYADTTTNAQFTIPTDAGYAQGDTYSFVIFQDSADTSTQKTINMMQDQDIFTVPSGTTLELKGQGVGSNLTAVTRNTTGGYRFDISGTIDAQYYSFNYLGSTNGGTGLYLKTGATVTNLSDGTFNNFVDITTGEAFITIDGGVIGTGTPSKTWQNMAFTGSGGPPPTTPEKTFEMASTGGSNYWNINNATCTGWTACDGSELESGADNIRWTTVSQGPTTDQQLRHGTWFNTGAKQPFTF